VVKGHLVPCICKVPVVLCPGRDLLVRLDAYGVAAMPGQEAVTTLDNLEAQKHVKRTLGYLESRVERVEAYLESRGRNLNLDVQRDTVQREIRQVPGAWTGALWDSGDWGLGLFENGTFRIVRALDW